MSLSRITGPSNLVVKSTLLIYINNIDVHPVYGGRHSADSQQKSLRG